jgi:hypothetical protein
MYRSEQKYIDSCAYHEAGHTVVAVALEMPLRNRGVHIDTRGNGISYYWFRKPGDPNNTADDILERERTVISTEAGFIAQKQFDPECPHGGNWFDRDRNIKLLDEMYPNRSDWFAAQDKLYAEALRLVDLHWQAIEAVAKAVLAQPLTPRANSERQWSTDTVERWIDGDRVVSIMKEFGLEPIIRDESQGLLYPSVTLDATGGTRGASPA